MKRFKAGLLALIAAVALSAPAWAAFPWGTSDPQEASGATPTITYSSTSFFGIEDMTANVTSVTLAGMTSGTYYAIAWVQDGTGSRTLTQSSITQASGGPAVPAIPSTANKWTVWVILATSASKATFVQNYDNTPIWDTFSTTLTATGGTVNGTASAQAASTEVIPGMTASNVCTCIMQAPDTPTAKLTFSCLPQTNAAECVLANATAAAITATAGSLNVRIAP